jgi:hypothetical protein
MFGFGEALVAVPLLALCMPLQEAAPLAVLLSVVIATLVLLQDWRDVHWRSAAGLIGATVLGIPLGLALLTCPHPRAVRVALALLIIVFSLWSLTRRAPVKLTTDRPAWILACGFLAGLLGGAFGMNGPPLVVYGGMRRWSPVRFRATLQAYFLPASLLGMVGYGLDGLWVPAITHQLWVSLPWVVPAIWLGRVLNRRFHPETFIRYAYIGLTAIGVLLLEQSL